MAPTLVSWPLGTDVNYAGKRRVLVGVPSLMSLVWRGSATWRICDPTGMRHGGTLTGEHTPSWTVVPIRRSHPGFSSSGGMRKSWLLAFSNRISDVPRPSGGVVVIYVKCAASCAQPVTRSMCDIELDRPRIRASLRVFIPRGGRFSLALVIFFCCHSPIGRP